MSQAARIRRNSVFAFLSQLIRLLTNFFLFVGIARFYGVEAFGQFTTAHTLSTIFLLFADFGFDSLLPTEIARNRSDALRAARQYFSLKVILVFCATSAMMSLPLFQELSVETETLIEIFSLYVFFSALNGFFFGLFKGLEEFHHETKISFWTNVLSLSLLVVLGFLHAPLYLIALSFVGTRVIGVIRGLQITSRLFGSSVIRFDFSRWRDHWRRVATFGVHFVFGNLLFQIDTILLSFWRGDRDVGVYQAAFKIVMLALIIPDIAISTLMPVLARLHKENLEKWGMFGRLLFKSLILLSLPISLVLYICAPQIIGLIYGTHVFAEAVPILQVFAFTIFVRFGVEAFAIMLTTSGRQSNRMVIVVGGTVMNLLLNSYFIPKDGPWGAALVSLMTNLFVGVGYVVFAKVSSRNWVLDWRILIPLVITAVLFVVGVGAPATPLWLVIPGVALLYVPMFYFVGYSRNEWRLIMSGPHALAQH